MTTTSLGQYCITVTDLDESVALYEALGLQCTSRTEIPQAFEAILENPNGGSKLQLAQMKDAPFVPGNAFWKLYVNTNDIADTFDRAVAAGCAVVSEPERLERWPVSVAFVTDLDGHLVELVQRFPWPEDAPEAPWLGQYCLNVTDIDQTVAFYEAAGLQCTSRTEIPTAYEAMIENPTEGSKLQLAQQKATDGPLEMGTMWKLYLHTDDCVGLHERLVSNGAVSTVAPMRLERWPVTIAFVTDPDGYQVELMQRHAD